jgi:hypothetical protein
MDLVFAKLPQKALALHDRVSPYLGSSLMTVQDRLGHSIMNTKPGLMLF